MQRINAGMRPSDALLPFREARAMQGTVGAIKW